MEPIRCAETSGSNYQPMPRNKAESEGVKIDGHMIVANEPHSSITHCSVMLSH